MAAAGVVVVAAVVAVVAAVVAVAVVTAAAVTKPRDTKSSRSKKPAARGRLFFVRRSPQGGGTNMKISVTHARAVAGHDLTVAVELDDKERVSWVQVTLDGVTLATDVLDPPRDGYEHDFAQVGDAGPQLEHTLEVEAIDDARRTSRATMRWTDEI